MNGAVPVRQHIHSWRAHEQFTFTLTLTVTIQQDGWHVLKMSYYNIIRSFKFS